MKDSEKLVERELYVLAKKHGGLAIKLSAASLVGVPDRLVLLPPGKVCFVELKTTRKKPTKIQLYFHRKLRVMGFGVHVIDTIEGVRDLINKINETH